MKKSLTLLFLIVFKTAFAQLSAPDGAVTSTTNPSTGNVGIGTSTPKASLDVSTFISNGAIGTVLGRLPEGNSSGEGTFLGVRGYGTQMPDYDGKSFSLEHSFYGSVNSSVNFFRGGSVTGGSIAFNTNNNTERVRIDANGNVGIGTSAPKALLDVSTFISNGALGTVLGRLPEGNSSGDGTFLGVRGYGTQFTDYSGKSFSIEHSFYGSVNSSVNFYRGGGVNGGSIAFNTSDNTERMRIDGNGNIGIGTSAPDAKLAVNGTVHAREVRVDLSGWPDYVFANTYKLRPLSQIETFIQQNQHLPEVPSAAEVEKNGVNLGAMDALLLKKIEELTLYTIEMNKKVEAISKDNEIIKNENATLNEINKNLELRIKQLEN